MKKIIFEFRFLFILLLIFFVCSDLKSQTLPSKDSLIRIQKIKIFAVSNPAPQYIVEIKNDMTISFYNILPENFSKDHPGFKGWFVDSTSIKIENSDFIDLKKTINGIDLENINKLEKPNSENGIEIFISGCVSDKYIIELKNQKIESSIDPNNEKYISESLKIIRNIFDKLEGKYKPTK